MFLQLFGIGKAVTNGLIAKESVNGDTLFDIFRRLKRERGVPCVFVVDDAQRLFTTKGGDRLALYLQECANYGLVTTIFIGSEGSVFNDFRGCKLIRKPCWFTVYS